MIAGEEFGQFVSDATRGAGDEDSSYHIHRKLIHLQRSGR